MTGMAADAGEITRAVLAGRLRGRLAPCDDLAVGPAEGPDAVAGPASLALVREESFPVPGCDRRLGG